MQIRTKFMHIRQKKNRIHGDLRSFLGMPWLHAEYKNCFGTKKDKYTSDFFALYYYLFWTICPPPMLLFGAIVLLNLTDLPPYTDIWPLRLFGTEYLVFAALLILLKILQYSLWQLAVSGLKDSSVLPMCTSYLWT